jgi:hypothetical protein
MRKGEMTLVSAAALLRVPWHRAHRWVLEGILDGHQAHGRWFVSRASISRMARALTVGVGSTALERRLRDASRGEGNPGHSAACNRGKRQRK